MTIPNPPPRRHPEAPRSHPRGEGSSAGHLGAMVMLSVPHTASLARLRSAVHRDDACIARGR
jgi:hypothetical protein